LVCALDNAAGVGPVAAQITFGHAQVAKIIGTQRGEPGHLGTLDVFTFDGNNAHVELLTESE
jgi:hypothetical protein